MKHRCATLAAALLAVGIVLALGGPLNRAWAPVAGATTRISVDLYGHEANGNSAFPVISADARFVAFYSDATNLVSGDTNTFQDIFVHDRATGGINRASVRPDGTQADGHSYAPALSADGRYVAFHSYATNLVPGDTNDWVDVFVQDRLTGDLTRVSVASDGSEGLGGGSLYPAISASGRYVAFRSCADNLVPSDTNDDCDIFVHDRDADDDNRYDEPGQVRTLRVSVSSGGTEATGDSDAPSISADGRFVAFESYAADLVAGDTNGTYDVFLHDRDSDADGVMDEPGAVSTVRVSVASDGGEANGISSAPALSADGRYVAFESEADNLVPTDGNEYQDVFLHDWRTGLTVRVSVSSGGTEGDGHSETPAISFNGQYIAFVSWAYDLDPACSYAARHVFVRDRLTGQTSCVSLASDGTQAYVDSWNPSLSADGRFVAFGSDADNLVPDDTNESRDIFLRDWTAPAPVAARIPTSGGVLAASGVVLTFPPDTFSDTVVITHTTNPAGAAPSPGVSLSVVEPTFDLDAVYASSGGVAQPSPGRSYSVTLSYGQADKGPAVEETLGLYSWDGDQWVREPSSTVDVATNTLVAAPDHLSTWAVMGETRRIYLPVAITD
jgi:Tol biopolymer transport system component